MRATSISEGIHWVGAIDAGLRDFHGFETPRGTTYNAYLVRGSDRTALVDTVKAAFVPELLERVRSVVDPASVDLIVVNHVEPDHNGGLREVMAAMPGARVVASGSGVRGVAEYHGGLEVEAVGAGDVIDLGGRTLRFLPVPMVHWPDSMFTYCPEDRVLMPNDALGQHLATEERFADEAGLELALEELAVYYANILMPLGPQVAKAVEKLAATGWGIDTLAPSHGVAWRGEGLARALEAYSRMTAGETRAKVVVAYATMWGSTRELATAVAEGAREAGAEVELFDLAASPFAAVTRALLDSRVLLLGSPTLHHGMLHPVAGYIQYLSGLKPAGKAVGVFGSYGWSSGATAQMTSRLAEAGIAAELGEITVKYRPTGTDLDAAAAWGRAAGERARG